MSETIKQVWLKDRSDNKVAPYTTTSQVIDTEGTPLDTTLNELNEHLENVNNGVLGSKTLVFNEDGTVSWE